MIEVPMSPADLARVRFVHSPMRELVASLRVLADRRRHHAYRGWLSAVRGRLAAPWLVELVRLAAAAPHPPGFLAPVPQAAWGCLDDELDAIAATAPDAVRSDLERCHPRQVPAVLRPLYEAPAARLPTVVSRLRSYWQATMEPAWHRVQALCTADVHYRAEEFAAGGIARVLGGLHPSVSFAGDRLTVDDAVPGRRHVDPDDAGLLLIPCAFSWPNATVIPAATAVTYPPRGVGLLWRPSPRVPPPLGALIGRTRADLLATLALPATTTQLARKLDVSAAAVSRHLKILEANGLVTGRRRGKLVHYLRTPAGRMLLMAAGPAENSGGDGRADVTLAHSGPGIPCAVGLVPLRRG